VSCHSDGTRLSVDRWVDPVLDAHRRRVRYDDYRCSVSARSGREGASVRWLGHVDRPEPDAAAEAGPPADPPGGDDLWGGLIDYDGSYTTPTRERSSGARPSGSAQKRENKAGGRKNVGEASPRVRRRTRWTPDRWYYEEASAALSWAGPDPGWVTGLARRFGWHPAEQAALETNRVMRLGRSVRSPEALTTHFARCFARPQNCSRTHRGVCGRNRLDLYRGRRLDQDLETRATGSHPRPVLTPTPTTVGASPAAGGGVATPAPDAVTAELPDPDVLLTRVAAEGPPRLAALASRLSHRLATTPHQQQQPQQ